MLLILTMTLVCQCAYSFNIRQTSNEDGLSNSAILSMSLDDMGYLWIGTCDGVNIADGTEIHPFSSIFPGQSISGNIIEDLLTTTNGITWVLTNYGLDLVDYEKGIVTTFTQFHGQEHLCVSDNGTLFALAENNHILRHDRETNKFEDLGSVDHPFLNVLRISANKDKVSVFTSKGIFPYSIPENGASSKKLATAKGGKRIDLRFVKQQGEIIYMIDASNKLLRMLPDNTIQPVTDLNEELSKRGEISDLINDHQNNFFISFSTDGVLRVGINTQGQFQTMDLGLRVGVFCLEKSPYQDVAWIGTDCQGIYTYWDDQYSIRSFDFHDFKDRISHPVRSILVDKQNNLWLGTKGDGLLRVRNFNEYYPKVSLADNELFTSSNSTLLHNSVYSLGESKRPILWIGTEDGLNYYNYTDDKIYPITLNPDIKMIHGLYEENDSTLWLASVGQGVAKLHIGGSSSSPVVKSVKIFTTGDANPSSNFFFSLTSDSKGRMLFCNRGLGVFEIKDEKLVRIPLKNNFGSSAVNDVFDALATDNALWLGTGHGLIKTQDGKEELFLGPEHGFINNTIHDMLHHEETAIWISTNKGIVRFNPTNSEAATYGKNYGLSVTEYSDGAGFDTGTSLIFGGINGITTINKHKTYVEPETFVPMLSIIKLEISGNGVPTGSHFNDDGKHHSLVFESDENHFAITFAAPDYINAPNYTYYYTLDGTDWISNGSSSTITFNQMNHGNYNLQVKYVNRATGFESEPYDVKLVVKAPWHLTTFAKIIYLIIIISIGWVILMLYLRRQKEKQEKKMLYMEQAHKEEVYEEKLRFFTNITHEFCTPLTLIYGPCERILSYPGSDDYIRKYVGLIRTNTERLNNLIQELIDFRRMETGHKKLRVRQVNVTDLCNETFESFSELAERNNVTFVNEIKPDLSWNSDYSCLKKILNNLISNSFKYTPPEGTIKVGAEEVDGRLRLSVYNTGKGISDKDKERIFNRYTVLDNVEQNAIKGISSRNGLGMAICHSMVDMLHGRISIESEVGKYAEFIVVLPQLTLTETQPQENIDYTTDYTTDHTPAIIQESDSTTPETRKRKRKTEPEEGNESVLIIDDNTEILSLLRDSLTEYTVMSAENAEVGLRILKENPPSLIISDIMMPGTDGTELARQIKSNRHTMHIPLILLSAKTSNEEKIKGLEAGADAYIGKPFSVSYLRAMVKRLIENRESLKEYYNSSASTIQFKKGKLVNLEETEFISKVTEFLDQHMANPDVSVEQLALHLKMSARNVYRKFKELGESSPNDFIKRHRLNYAGKLLLTTSLTVQEIIFRCGFSNRSHFYKEFQKCFNMSPKEYRISDGGTKHSDTGKTTE